MNTNLIASACSPLPDSTRGKPMTRLMLYGAMVLGGAIIGTTMWPKQHAVVARATGHD